MIQENNIAFCSCHSPHRSIVLGIASAFVDFRGGENARVRATRNCHSSAWLLRGYRVHVPRGGARGLEREFEGSRMVGIRSIFFDNPVSSQTLVCTGEKRLITQVLEVHKAQRARTQEGKVGKPV